MIFVLFSVFLFVPTSIVRILKFLVGFCPFSWAVDYSSLSYYVVASNAEIKWCNNFHLKHMYLSTKNGKGQSANQLF